MATLKNNKLTFANGEALNIFNVGNPVGTTDANDYTAPGVYFSELRNNVAAGGYYILVVLGNNDYKWQIILNYFANEIYVRRYTSASGWDNWYEIQKTIVS